MILNTFCEVNVSNESMGALMHQVCFDIDYSNIVDTNGDHETHVFGASISFYI